MGFSLIFGLFDGEGRRPAKRAAYGVRDRTASVRLLEGLIFDQTVDADQYGQQAVDTCQRPTVQKST
ncbi:MAG TPA: hypothetical protein PKY22_13440, partial [Accumulibacter sp.]|nr:hypothetical protein [Accumulibacter sp.]